MILVSAVQAFRRPNSSHLDPSSQASEAVRQFRRSPNGYRRTRQCSLVEAVITLVGRERE
jgi:hypothetical protein